MKKIFIYKILPYRELSVYNLSALCFHVRNLFRHLLISGNSVKSYCYHPHVDAFFRELSTVKMLNSTLALKFTWQEKSIIIDIEG